MTQPEKKPHTGERGLISGSAALHSERLATKPPRWPSVYYCKVPCKCPPPFKHKFLRKVGGGRLLGILPFVQPLKVQVNTKRLEFKQKSIYSNFKTKGKRKLVIFKHTHPVCLSQSKTGHIATENHSHNFPLALLLRFIVSFSSSLK